MTQEAIRSTKGTGEPPKQISAQERSEIAEILWRLLWAVQAQSREDTSGVRDMIESTRRRLCDFDPYAEEEGG